MILCCPVYQNHELTAQMVASLAQTVRGSFTLVIVDNASPDPYGADDYHAWGRTPFPVVVIRNDQNEGNFWPLRQVADLPAEHDIVAICHNDVIFYEPGWDERVEAAFRDDPRLGMLGFAGDDEIGADGQRVSTMSNLRGTRGHASAEQLGTRITDLRPAAAVDGLFMAFRRRVLEHITLDRTMPPAHFFDFIWGAQLVRAGWRIATLGVEIDHIGWSTGYRLSAELDGEWRRWCAERDLEAGDDPMAVIRARGERDWRWLRGRYWPCRMGADWIRHPTGLVAGVSMFRNERDVAEHVIRHMLDECDFVVVADNNSDDGTRQAIEAIGDPRLHIFEEPSYAYNQATTMKRMADEARARGALWVVPFDFDEWWDSAGGRIADVLRAMPDGVEFTATRTADMIPQPTDPDDPNPFRRITHTRPDSLWSQVSARKVAYVPADDRIPLQGNHGIVGMAPWDVPVGPLRLRHYPFRSFEQAAAKLRHGREAILAANLPTSSGTHWQKWGAYSDAELRAWWAEWTDPAGLLPWTGGETRAIIAAAGTSDRWGDYLGVPKQELVIDGEPLLGRTVRLLRKLGIRDIVITGDWPGYGVPTAQPKGDTAAVDGRLAMRHLWNPDGRTIVLMGDVYYGEDAMRVIVTHAARDAHLFARFGPSSFSGKPWAEIFANSFWPEHHEAHAASLEAVQAMRDRGQLGRAGLWEAYLHDHGHLGDGIDGQAGRVGNYGDATEIDDWTEDFDWPQDFDTFMACRSAQVTDAVTSIVVATPSRGTIHSRTIEAVMANVRDVPGFLGWTVTHDLPIPDCHETVTEQALASGAGLIWFVEEDVIPPPDALRESLRLVAEGYDMVAVDYPVGAASDGWGCLVRNAEGEILWCGLGATLIRREVFEKLPQPWFATDTRYIKRGGGVWEPAPQVLPNEKRYGQQDIYFCMTLREAGFRIGQVPDMTASHAKVEAYGEQGTNVGFHTISIRDTILKQYPG